MLRLFIATTQTSSVFAALHAKRTCSPPHRDVLLLDAVEAKTSLVREIKNSKSIHPWHEVIDFSRAVPDETDTSPSLKKKLTRNLKSTPLFRELYRFLYARHEKRAAEILFRNVDARLKHLRGEKAELYLLTQTRLNGALIPFFPDAAVNYLEHGLGDYLYVQDEKIKKNNFYCVFSEPFKKHLAVKGRDAAFALPAFSPASFQSACSALLEGHAGLKALPDSPGQKGVLILMENVEMYNVPSRFWPDYIDKCLEQIPDYKNYFYIVKPHHLQSAAAIERTKAHLEKLQLSFRFIGEKEMINFGAEVLFTAWRKDITHVFSLFSSSLFYLSALYPDAGITYHYSVGFMKKYVAGAPEQFKKHFYGLEELIKEVFSGNCRSF